MNRGILDVRLAAVLFIFLVGSVSLININQKAEANEVINATCSSCPLSSDSSSIVQVLNTTILEGEEKNKAVAAALSSEDYKNVKKLFPESVYDPVRDNATAGIVSLVFNGTESEVSAVFIPFEAEAGLSAGIIFITNKGHGMTIGVVVDLQSEAPLFAAMSMDGKTVEIPLVQGSPCSSCSSCGSGVSSMVDNCGTDSDCYQYGPDYCCVDGWCQYCECWSDYDCEQLYGSDYCCVDRQCVYCPLPPQGECIEWDWPKYYYCMALCTGLWWTICSRCLGGGLPGIICFTTCALITLFGCDVFCKWYACTEWS